MLARRTLRSVNITDEALAGAVAPTAAGLTVVAVPAAAGAVDSTAVVADSTAVAADSTAVAADSTAVAADTTAARVFVAGCQPDHGKWVVARIGDPED